MKFTTVERKRTEESKNSALKQILDNAVVSEGVTDIFAIAGLERPNIGLLSEEFLDDIRKMPQKNLAVELLERLMRDEIRSNTRGNVVQEKKFSERLLETLRKYHNRAIETKQVIEELIAMAKDLKESAGAMRSWASPQTRSRSTTRWPNVPRCWNRWEMRRSRSLRWN